MWTETGLMQGLPGVTAPKGAGLGEPRDEDGFAALLAVPFLEAVEDAGAQVTAGDWPVWAAVPLAQVVQLPRAGFSGADDAVDLGRPDAVVSEVALKPGTALTAERPTLPDGAGGDLPSRGWTIGAGVASGSHPMAGPPASGAAGGSRAVAEVLAEVPEAVSGAYADREGPPGVRLEPGIVLPGKAAKGPDAGSVTVNEGATAVAVATEAETAESPASLGSAATLTGAGEPLLATDAAEHAAPGAPRIGQAVLQRDGSVPGAGPLGLSAMVSGDARSHQSMSEAGSALAVPIEGGEPVQWALGEGIKEADAAREVPRSAAPVSLIGVRAIKADGEALREDEAVALEGPLPSPEPDDAAKPTGRNGEVNRPASEPGATKAERIWFGLVQWTSAGGEMALRGRGDALVTAPTGGRGDELATARIAGNPPVPHGPMVLPQVLAAPALPASGAAALPLPDLVEPVPHESDLAAFTWSTPAQPLLPGPIAASTLPAAAVTHLALGIVAHLQQRADGKTEIALSPAELGSVRLRLETDARDPDRIIVHLGFDRPETMDLFRRHADQLTEAMRAAGYSEARLDFGQHGPAGGGGQDASGRNAAGGDMAEPTNPRAGHPEPNPTPSLRLAAAAGLDLRL